MEPTSCIFHLVFSTQLYCHSHPRNARGVRVSVWVDMCTLWAYVCVLWMYMRECVSLHVYIFMRVCMWLWLYICECVWVNGCVCTCMLVHVYVCVYEFVWWLDGHSGSLPEQCIFALADTLPTRLTSISLESSCGFVFFWGRNLKELHLMNLMEKASNLVVGWGGFDSEDGHVSGLS